MGFFSWKTQDTNKSIANSYSNRPTFEVTMTDNNNNKWTETCYNGYGVFNGKDYYSLLSEMNRGNGDRLDGINKGLHPENYDFKIIYPNLTENKNHEWIDSEPECCEYQGYFYD